MVKELSLPSSLTPFPTESFPSSRRKEWTEIKMMGSVSAAEFVLLECRANEDLLMH